MRGKRKLLKVATFSQIMADGHQVDGTRLYVLELLMFGFAYSSYYLLLKSTGFLTKLDDTAVRDEVMQHPYRFGKKLEFGKQLDLDRETQCIYYTGEVKAGDVIHDDAQG